MLVLMANGAGAATVMLRLAVVVAGVDCESVTCTVKLEVPDVVGVPVIAPVLALRLSPAGRLPVVRLQVYGAMPPFAASVAE